MKRSIQDLDLQGKRVLIRVDFNVPLNRECHITDDNRIRESIPTIQLALGKGASRVILMSHLGRPKGIDPLLSLRPVSIRLSEILGTSVLQCSDCSGPKVLEEINSQSQERVFLLENLRYYPEEEKNDPAFAKGLASLADVYVNDAFGTSHRSHASVDAITRFLPSAAGLLMEKELKYLGELLKKPTPPFVAVLGGAKVSDKIGVVENLIYKIQKILIGGAMAYTFMKAKGLVVGSSRIETDRLDLAEEILKKAAVNRVEILLPEDHVIVQRVGDDAPFEVSDTIPPGWFGVDIGPKTIRKYAQEIQQAKTILWNGPMGIFEMKHFQNGSIGVAKAMADTLASLTIVGGGDTASCVRAFGLSHRFTHVSTGGGASLEFLEGKKLPGVEALGNKN